MTITQKLKPYKLGQTKLKMFLWSSFLVNFLSSDNTQTERQQPQRDNNNYNNYDRKHTQ